jgi:hypothetical protein
MVQDRDLFFPGLGLDLDLPETGLGLALPETGLGLALPETGFVAKKAPCNDKSGCFFGWLSSYPQTIVFAFDDPVVEYDLLDIQYNH